MTEVQHYIKEKNGLRTRSWCAKYFLVFTQTIEDENFGKKISY